MDTPLKQRVVGAIVLVAVAVIVVPAILDGSGYKSRHARSIEIPAKPVFPPLSQDTVKPIPTPLDQTFEKQPQQTEAEEQAKAKLKSWMLQVGTFDSRDNAENYRNELRAKGHTTHVIKGKSNNKTVYKVQIGPDLSKKRIEALRDKLKKQGIDGYVVSHG